MTKAELIEQIEGEYRAAQACVMFVYIVATAPWRDTVKNYVGPARLHIRSKRFEHVIEFSPDQILRRYEDSGVFEADGLNIIQLGITNAIRRSFELFKEYCSCTSQEQKLRQFDWYHFARIIRNSFSHNFRMNFTLPLTRDEKKAGLSVKWLLPQTLKFSGGPITLDKSMHDQEVDFDTLPIPYALELIGMMKTSAQTL